jgi:hypothetical protein
MPSSAVRTFDDPDDYTASLRGVTSELTITGRGRFAARLVSVNLHSRGARILSMTPGSLLFRSARTLGRACSGTV